MFTKLDLGLAGYGMLLAAEGCSDTLITQTPTPCIRPVHKGSVNFNYA